MVMKLKPDNTQLLSQENLPDYVCVSKELWVCGHPLLQFSQPKMVREWPEPQGSDLCEQFHLITLLCLSSLIIVCVCHDVEGLGDSLGSAR